MDETRKVPNDATGGAPAGSSQDNLGEGADLQQWGIADDPVGTAGGSGTDYGSIPGGRERIDGFDPIDPEPDQMDEDDDGDLIPILPGESEDESPQDDDLVSPGLEIPFYRSTPV